MNITSLSFIIFIFALWVIYYILPKKYQWILLLIASIGFYIYGGATSIIYVLLTSLSVYVATCFIEKLAIKNKLYIKENKNILSKEEKKKSKEKIKKQRRAIIVVTIIFNLAFLGIFKYSHFFIEQINSLLKIIDIGQINNTFNLIIPIGISYYTLQAIGYMVDVFWGKSKAEKNYFKVLLFISFFPQITQGPISEYNYLSRELFKEHTCTYENFSRGFQRLLWGFFKKMVVADALSPYVTTVLSGYEEYTGITCVVGALLYMFQLYADFSGYMDIMCGYCEMLDIKLTENFNRPYFSKSIAELWRRWHISLGAWLRTYVYYPVAVSKWNQRLSQKIRKPFGDYVAGKIAATVPLLFVWFSIGLWHDASWEYIGWGFGNAFFIILSVWLEPVYESTRNRLSINEKSFIFKSFQIVRTFVIFTFLEIVAAVYAMGGNGFNYIKRIFTNTSIPHSLNALFPTSKGLSNFSTIMLLLALGGLIIMFFVSLLQRKKQVRDYFNKIPIIIRIMIIALTLIVIVSFGVQNSWGAGAFMYENF